MSPGMSDDLRGKYEKAKEETDGGLAPFCDGTPTCQCPHDELKDERSAASALIESLEGDCKRKDAEISRLGQIVWEDGVGGCLTPAAKKLKEENERLREAADRGQAYFRALKALVAAAGSGKHPLEIMGIVEKCKIVLETGLDVPWDEKEATREIPWRDPGFWVVEGPMTLNSRAASLKLIGADMNYEVHAPADEEGKPEAGQWFVTFTFRSGK